MTPFIPQGPLFDWVAMATPGLVARDIRLAEVQRDWDHAIWPHATAGFFKVRQAIPRILDQVFGGQR